MSSANMAALYKGVRYFTSTLTKTRMVSERMLFTILTMGSSLLIV